MRCFNGLISKTTRSTKPYLPKPSRVPCGLQPLVHLPTICTTVFHMFRSNLRMQPNHPIKDRILHSLGALLFLPPSLTKRGAKIIFLNFSHISLFQFQIWEEILKHVTMIKKLLLVPSTNLHVVHQWIQFFVCFYMLLHFIAFFWSKCVLFSPKFVQGGWQ